MSPKPPPPPISAPGLVGPVSILNQPISGPRSNRRARSRPYSHARLEVDLRPAEPVRGPAALRVQAFFQSHSSRAPPDLLSVAAATLHAFSARRFRWVDHWELDEGRWLPLPHRGPAGRVREPVGELLDALARVDPLDAAKAGRFAARLSSLDGGQADLRLRPRRRSGRGALLIDLYGSWDRVALDGLSAALSERLPVQRVLLVKYQYA